MKLGESGVNEEAMAPLQDLKVCQGRQSQRKAVPFALT
jgi:hypothetical protein